MEFRLGEIHRIVGGDLRGDPEIRITGVRSLDSAGPRDLSFVRDDRFRDAAERSPAAALLVPSGQEWERTVIVVENPEVALIKVLTLVSQALASKSTGVHATAVIEEGVSLGDDVFIDAHATVKTGSRIGPRCRIGASTTIGARSELGAEVAIYPNVTIYEDTRIGDRVIVHSGTVIGSDGFGYIQHGGEHVKIPHIGRVVIEDDVEIGAGCTIDRAMLDQTVIHRGAKIDDQVHIGHNCSIGELALLAGATHLSGSTSVGKGAVLAGAVETSDGISIGDGARVGGGTQLFADVPAGASWWGGIPGREGEIAKRIAATLPYLPEMRRSLRRILAQLDIDPKGG